MQTPDIDDKPLPGRLPLVVQLGFSGSRFLYGDEVSAEQQAGFDQQLTEELRKEFIALRTKLGLNENHFLCGISQMAIGADMLFARACAAESIPHRVFLPQTRDEFLNAMSSNGKADFSEAEKEVARELLDSPNVIQERVVSDAVDRRQRFEESNLEILHVSDVMICLLRDDAGEKPGGSQQMLSRATGRNVATLEMRVSVREGRLICQSTFHPCDGACFEPPALPDELSDIPAYENLPTGGVPDGPDFFGFLKDFGSKRANEHRRFFQNAAFAIILTHVIATIISAYSLAAHSAPGGMPHDEVNVAKDQRQGGNEAAGDQNIVEADNGQDVFFKGLFLMELILLASGFTLHLVVHRAKVARNWAYRRLVAEINRSIITVQNVPAYLAFLFRLPFPNDLRPVLRTLNVLHLRTTRSGSGLNFDEFKEEYIRNRVDNQARWYSDRAGKARKWSKIASMTFKIFSGLAIVVVLLELFHLFDLGSVLGLLSVIFPVMAVAATSLAAATDLDARIETFEQAAEFLREQLPLIEKAESMTEMTPFIVVTEERLLGEVANWYSRRTYLGIV